MLAAFYAYAIRDAVETLTELEAKADHIVANQTDGEFSAAAALGTLRAAVVMTKRGLQDTLDVAQARTAERAA